jgi:hypothetical protein
MRHLLHDRFVYCSTKLQVCRSFDQRMSKEESRKIVDDSVWNKALVAGLFSLVQVKLALSRSALSRHSSSRTLNRSSFGKVSTGAGNGGSSTYSPSYGTGNGGSN